MIKTELKFQRAEVESFSLKDPIQIKVYFNDGKNKMLSFKVPLQNTAVEAHNIITAIRKYVREVNQSDMGDHFLDNFVTVVMDDEELIEERMKNFLQKIFDRRHQMSGSRMHSGYLDMLNMAKSIKIDFASSSARDADTGRSLRRL